MCNKQMISKNQVRRAVTPIGTYVRKTPTMTVKGIKSVGQIRRAAK